mgnify:CR=1 FL=1
MTNVMSNAKPQPGSTGATRAAHTSPWAQSHPNKQTTNTQQYERKRPQHSYYKSRDLTGQSSGDITRGTTPVMWRYTLYVTLHPIRTGAMPTDRVHRARRQERSWNLESRNTEERGLNTPIQNLGLGRTIKWRRHVGRYTRYVALHPIRTGAMPTDRVYRARRQERSRNLESHNTKDNGLNTPSYITRDLVIRRV